MTSSAHNLRRQMIEDRISHIAAQLDVSKDIAFMRLTYALLFNTSYDDPDFETDLVDGGGDKQVDIIHIEQVDEQAVVSIVQVKNTSSYKGTVVVQMRDGLDWIFERPEEQYSKLTNQDLARHIKDIRDITGSIGSKKLTIRIYYVAKGNTNALSPDFKQEIENTNSIYKSGNHFKEFSFSVWGVDELVNQIETLEHAARKVDIDIPIRKEWEVPSYAIYYAGEIKALLCTVEAKAIAEIVDKHVNDIFEENVRTFLGDRKSVNSRIYETCRDDQEAVHFWFYNNGVTATCDDFDVAHNAQPAIVKVKNMQIVNGCQTSMTLRKAWKDGVLSNNTMILLKLYETSNKDFVDQITLTTNSQNAVTNRDLSSNDLLQRHLEDLFKSRGYYYERKPRMYESLSRSERRKVISNEKLAQAHLAISEKIPALAMAQKSKVWSNEYYNTIFSAPIQALLSSFLVYKYCVDRRKDKPVTSVSSLDQSLKKYGLFHLARILMSLELGENWKALSIENLQQFIKKIEDDPDTLNNNYTIAVDILRKVVSGLMEGDTTRLINIFKSSEIQQRIDEELA